MNIAVIGAGFAGLSVAYFLRESGAKVTLFEKERVGAGASGVSSGLLHPYPGLLARRSYKASEALAVAKELLRVAEKHTPKMVASEVGIFRKSLEEEQHNRLIGHAEEFRDVQAYGKDLFLIHSGITVLSENYLEGLSLALSCRGVQFETAEITSLDELNHYDHVVVAAGYGIKTFPELASLPVKFLKGQALSVEGMPPHDRSLIAKGYIAHVQGENHFAIGSTYESSFTSIAPDLEVAKTLLQDKLMLCKEVKVLDCKAAVRVCKRGHYAPIAETISPKLSVFTALGSRGLLYHGLYGRMLAAQILANRLS